MHDRSSSSSSMKDHAMPCLTSATYFSVAIQPFLRKHMTLFFSITVPPREGGKTVVMVLSRAGCRGCGDGGGGGDGGGVVRLGFRRSGWICSQIPSRLALPRQCFLKILLVWPRTLLGMVRPGGSTVSPSLTASPPTHCQWRIVPASSDWWRHCRDALRGYLEF